MGRPRIRTNRRILLVEGVVDKRFVVTILKRFRLHSDAKFIEVKPLRGIGKLLRRIPTYAKVGSQRTVGIIADSDRNVQHRWDQIRKKLPHAPPRPRHGGVIIDSDPRVGIWLMPNNRDPGELEDFLIRMIPSQDPVFPHSQEYVRSVRQYGKAKSIAKAHFYSWLSVQDVPVQMKWAIDNLNAENSSLMADFVQWMKDLYHL